MDGHGTRGLIVSTERNGAEFLTFDFFQPPCSMQEHANQLVLDRCRDCGLWREVSRRIIGIMIAHY
jgi:hypothetical protein